LRNSGAANPEQRHLVEWTQKFLQQCAADRTRVSIPAPVVAESLLRVPLAEHATVVGTFARNSRIPTLNLAAVRQFARVWTQREPKLRADDLRGGVTLERGF
jgi:hypothetical protein